MGRKSRRDIAEAAIRDELTTYYLTADADQGLSSSFMPLVNIARGGFGGAPDPERRIVRRHEVGRWETRVSRARIIRTTLQRLRARERDVLFAAFGPLDWPAMVDAAFDRGMGQRATKRLGGLVGVAMLTDAVTRGFARDTTPSVVSDGWNRWERVPATRDGEPLYRCAGPASALRSVDEPSPKWETIGAWLIYVCVCAKDDAMAERVRKEARALLAGAVESYRTACAEVAA